MYKVLIVEDEGIVAKSIQSRLEKMGYAVPGIIANGEEVIDAAMSLKPDVILMDIHLKSRVDGIEVVKRMRDQIHIPVIYLTAYADEDTLQRAIQTEPHGYIVKPFSQVDLRAAIENAIHKFQIEKEKEKQLHRIQEVLNHINDALIITDQKGRIQSLNRLAMNLTGFKQEAVGLVVEEVVQYLSKNSDHLGALIAQAVKEKKPVHVSTEAKLFSKTGVERAVTLSIIPLYDDLAVLGAVACILTLVPNSGKLN